MSAEGAACLARASSVIYTDVCSSIIIPPLCTQFRQVRTLLQKRLCRPITLESIGDMTIGGLRALAEEAGQGETMHPA